MYISQEGLEGTKGPCGLDIQFQSMQSFAQAGQTKLRLSGLLRMITNTQGETTSSMIQPESDASISVKIGATLKDIEQAIQLKGVCS